MPENVPRRMMRFYRNAEQKQLDEDKEYGKEDFVAPNGRPILSEIPSMSYEDLELDKKNYEELKKIHEKNLEEKLALSEVENFKNRHNRLPTKEESNQIAENLYTQLKNTDMSKIYPEMASQQSMEMGQGRKNRRLARARAKETGSNEIQNEEIKSEQQQFQQPVSSNIVDVKALLEDNTDMDKKSKKGDEFDLGLDEDMGENNEIIGEENTREGEEEELDKKQKCPNCKKGTEKIIYCPKCGTAFCENCAKKEAGQIVCPKCGQKIKQ